MTVVAVCVANANMFGKIGVISGVGKGIIASSTGLLLKTIGLNVTSIVRPMSCCCVLFCHSTAVLCSFALSMSLSAAPVYY